MGIFWVYWTVLCILFVYLKGTINPEEDTDTQIGNAASMIAVPIWIPDDPSILQSLLKTLIKGTPG